VKREPTDRSAESYRELLEGLGDIVYEMDADGVLTYVSPAVEGVLGYPAADLVGRPFPGLIHPLDRRRAQVEFSELRGGEIGPRQYRLRHRDGGSRWVRTSSRPRLVDGRFAGIRGVLADVTDLRESHERLRLLAHAVRSIGEGVCVTDADDTIRFVNEPFAQIFGYAVDELVGRPIQMLRPPDFPAELAAAIGAGTAAGGFRGDVPNLRRDGARILVSLATSLVTDETGAVVGQVGVVRDVTEQRRSEAARRASDARYRALFEASSDGVLLLEDGRVLEANAAAAEMFGMSREELIGKAPWEISPPFQGDGRDSEPAALEMLALARAGARKRFPWQHLGPGGVVVHADISLSRVEIGGLDLVQALVRDVTERVRSEALERKRLRQLAAVSAVARHVASELDAAAVQRAAVEEIRTAFDFHNVTLLLLDEEAGVLGRQAMAGAYAAMAQSGYVQRVGEGLIGAAAATGATVLVNDVTADPRFVGGFGWEVATRAELAVPVKLGGRVLGVLDIQETRVGAFDEVDVQTLETLADQIALSLHNARLFERLEAELGERRRTQAALRASEERYRLLAENAHDLIVLISPQGTIEYCNQRALDVSGYRADEVASLSLDRLIAPEYSDAWRALWQRRTEGASEQFLYEVEFVTRDGRHIPAEVSSQPILQDGRLTGILVVARDVTARRAAAAALRAERDRARQYLDLAPVLFVALDADGRVTLANRRTCEVLGRPEAEITGADWFGEYLPAAVRGGMRTAFAQLLAGDRGVFGSMESPVRTAAGDERLVSWRNALLRDDAGTVIGVLSAGEDITERTHLEEQLRHAQKLDAMGRLAGGVAHDFNNLLQAMLATVQLLRLGAAGEAQFTDTARELEEHVRRGASLARQLLLFAKRGVTQPERLDLNDLVVDAVSLLRRLVRENVRVSAVVADRPLPVDGDRGQLEQVLTNLALNAVDAMPEGGDLCLRTGVSDDGRVWLEVADTGHGMDDAVRERIFEPFFTTKGADKGTGLGLAVVHGIVAQHHGQIQVQSEPGRGSTFRILLPRHDSGVFASVAPEPARAGEPARGRGERILLVEDNEQIRTVFSRMLVRLGYHVVAVASGEEAGVLPSDPAFDLLISDVMLPGASGVDVARGMLDRWPRLRVILMSGYAEDEVLREEILSGHVHFLQKPIDLATLAQHVRAALGG